MSLNPTIINQILTKIAESCSIASAITKPGKTTLFDKSANGFCKEWIVGSIAKSQVIQLNNNLFSQLFLNIIKIQIENSNRFQ